VNRRLAALRKEKAIDIGKNELTILDRKLLSEMAQEG
jgi:hypothetical protein